MINHLLGIYKFDLWPQSVLLPKAHGKTVRFGLKRTLRCVIWVKSWKLEALIWAGSAVRVERLKLYFSKIHLSDHDWWLNRYCSIFRESWTQSCPPAQPHSTTPPKPAHLPAPKLFKSIWHTAFGFEHFSNAVARALYFKNDFDLFFGVGECIALYFLNYTHDSQVGAFLHERTIRGALNIFTLCLLLLSTQLQSAHCSAQYLLILTSLCFFPPTKILRSSGS